MKYITIPDAAIMTGKTVQALYQAAKTGKLCTKKIGGTYYTDAKSLGQYQVDKRFCDNLIVNGKRLYDADAGFYSVKTAALLLNVTLNKMYRILYLKVITYERRGRYYIIPITEIERIKHTDLEQYA